MDRRGQLVQCLGKGHIPRRETCYHEALRKLLLQLALEGIYGESALSEDVLKFDSEVLEVLKLSVLVIGLD